MIPAEAVEAAAKVAYEVKPAKYYLDDQTVTWEQLSESRSGQLRKDQELRKAHLALEAAAPYMLADILEDAANTAETDELTTAAEVIYDLRRHAKDLRPMLNNEGEK